MGVQTHHTQGFLICFFMCSVHTADIIKSFLIVNKLAAMKMKKTTTTMSIIPDFSMAFSLNSWIL